MITVIVPVWNEQGLLRAFLDDVQPRVLAVQGELLVIDGGSEDGTAAAARRPGVRLLLSKNGRGRQMNVGADAARGSLLVFLPVDTRPGRGVFRRLREIDADLHPLAGGFRLHFDCDRRFLKVVSKLHNLRARMTGVFYGDQVPFVRRDLFSSLGGFRQDINMEDLEFGARLRKKVRPEMQPLDVITSSRRFDEVGDLKATAHAAVLLANWTFRRRIGASRTFFDPVR